MHINHSLSKRIRFLLRLNNLPKKPRWIMSHFYCLVFKHKLCTWWLGQSGDVQLLLYAQLAFGQVTDCNTQTSTIPVIFTMISHSLQTDASITVGFTRGLTKSEWPQSPSHQTLQFQHHRFGNAVRLHFTQPCTTAGLIFLLLFETGERGAHTTFGPHNGVLDGCSLFPIHQTLFDEWFMPKNLWKRLPHANVN